MKPVAFRVFHDGLDGEDTGQIPGGFVVQMQGMVRILALVLSRLLQA